MDTIAHAPAGDPSLQAVVLVLAPAPPRLVLGQVSSFAAASGSPAARPAAIVRRARWSTARTAAPVTPAEGDDLVVGGLVLDTGTRTTTVDHRPVHLSNREFDVLVHQPAIPDRARRWPPLC